MVVGWGVLLVLYLKDVIAERQYSSMVLHGDLIETFHSLRYNTVRVPHVAAHGRDVHGEYGCP